MAKTASKRRKKADQVEQVEQSTDVNDIVQTPACRRCGSTRRTEYSYVRYSVSAEHAVRWARTRCLDCEQVRDDRFAIPPSSPTYREILERLAPTDTHAAALLKALKAIA